MALTKAKLIANNSATAAVIAANTVGSSEIAQNSVTSVQIPNNSLGTTQVSAAMMATKQNALGSGDVTSAMIANNSVTIAKLAVTDGTDGQVLKTNGSGTLSFGTNVATTINNNADNRLITGSGTANTLEGEANLVWNGTELGVGTTSPDETLHVNGMIMMNNANELRSKDTGGSTRTIVRVNSSNELQYGWSGSGPVAFMGGGSYTERMRIHTNGKVGIGTTSPTVPLDVYNGSGWGGLDLDGTSGAELRMQKAGTTYGQMYASDSHGFVINATNGLADILFQSGGSTKMILDNSGILAINMTPNTGLSNSSGSLQIKGSNDNYQATNFNEGSMLSLDATNSEGRYASIRFTHNGGTEGFFGLVRRGSTSDITDFVWQMYNGTTNTYQEHARLSSNALLTAAGKDNGAGYGTYGYMTCSTNLSGYTVGDYPTLKTDGATIHFDAQGTYTGYISHNTGFTNVSDEREKENIETISGATELVKQLRGVTHKWKDKRDDETHHGLIAQEVQKVVPDVVSEGAAKEGETPTLGVAYQKLVPLLIESIKELEARITELEG